MSAPQVPEQIEYPDSDGKPMADNTVQFRWIVVLFGNLESMFLDRKDVFVGGDLLWYPREGHPEICVAPDVFVVFDRPKGDRGSYKQWEEDDVPMTVVFEILSPSNTTTEVASKLAFYDEYGVEEYYTYNPFTNLLMVYIRKNGTLLREQVGSEFVSPRMRIRLRTTDSDLEVLFPDGSRFLPFEQVYEDRELERRRANQATAERDQATAERDRATAERDQVTAERDQATAERDQATAERDQVTAERDDAQARLARLIELGKKARQQTATPEELAELERLEDESLQ